MIHTTSKILATTLLAATALTAAAGSAGADSYGTLGGSTIGHVGAGVSRPGFSGGGTGNFSHSSAPWDPAKHGGLTQEESKQQFADLVEAITDNNRPTPDGQAGYQAQPDYQAQSSNEPVVVSAGDD
ncbi:hypothetical protein ACFWA9_30820 [Kitasatospora sp. NPDC059973]|uniref:hypothetical protein n=1 Tax=Kitasatospora sp. NPDC059973 TaxID=3347020 RepID=UPI00369FA703